MKAEYNKALDNALNNIKIFIRENLNNSISLYTLDLFYYDSWNIEEGFFRPKVTINSRRGNFKMTFDYKEVLKYMDYRHEYLSKRYEYINESIYTDSFKHKILTRTNIYDLTI